MAKSDRFRQQHEELLGLANDLAGELDRNKLTSDASVARSALSKLAGKLVLHLGAEDKYLYPDLMASNDTDTRNTAQKFVDEMGGIAEAFIAYKDKWTTAAAIQSNVDGFIDETKAIYGALAERIDKENNVLYPMMDKLA
jgi:hemerythrin-like domain-containing protein